MQNAPTGDPPKKHPNHTGRAAAGKRNIGPIPRTTVSWGDVDNQLLRDSIVAVTDAGAAILLGTTADRGAVSVTVLDGDSKIREYPHTAAEIETTLRWLVAMYSTD